MNHNTVMAVENHEADNQIDHAIAVQKLINDGTWALQGSFGREMMRHIEDGYCMLGLTRATDYYGNTIPARTDVEAGTKGSPEFVAARMGPEWLDELLLAEQAPTTH